MRSLLVGGFSQKHLEEVPILQDQERIPVQRISISLFGMAVFASLVTLGLLLIDWYVAESHCAYTSSSSSTKGRQRKAACHLAVTPSSQATNVRLTSVILGANTLLTSHRTLRFLMFCHLLVTYPSPRCSLAMVHGILRRQSRHHMPRQFKKSRPLRDQ